MVIGPAQRNRIADICRRYHVRRISLFGSAAVGTERPDSDVGLLVDMQGELVETFDGRKIDLAFPCVLRNPWRRRAIKAQLQTLYQ